MKFTIDPKIFEQNHDLKIGLILIKGMNNSRRVSAIESLLRGIGAQRGREFKEKDIHDEPMVRAWDSAYGKFGVNPKKFQPSIAALLSRVKAGKEIPHISALVDLYNYFSLKHLLPIGGEDLDWLCGDLTLAYTKGGEPFRPLGTIEVQQAKEGEIAYQDKGGITCRYWNYRECERTKFTNKTVNAALLIEDLSNMHMDKFGSVLREIEDALNKYIGGKIEIYILNEENNETDLGIEGRRVADDSKIPQQEVAHFLQVQEVKKKGRKRSKPKKSAKPKISSTKAKPSSGHLSEQLSLIEEENLDPLNLEDPNSLKEKIKSIVYFSVLKAFPKALSARIQIEQPAAAVHGDYSCNIALQLSKQLKLKPREIAEEIIKNIKNPDLIEKVEMAGPGFINFFVGKEYLTNEIKKILKENEKYGASKIGSNKTIVMDYSSPNIAKPLGVHHLLSTAIGQSIYNIFSKLGFHCVAVNHIGDWGTQFGKLIVAYRKWGSKEAVEKDPIGELLKLYVKFHNEAEAHPELEDEARAEFKKLEQHDKENEKLWKWFVKESLKEIEKTYNKLGGISFDKYHGESFYEDKLEEILLEGKSRGIFERGEEDAYVVKYDDPNLAPFVVQKKDGATLYSTRDFATLKYRINEWHPIKILYVVDVAQTLHFRQLFKAAERFNWYHGEGEHVWFGRMHMKDGQMSTRKGNVVLLDDLIDEAVSRATKIVEEKNPGLNKKEIVAKEVGIGGIKYNILCQNRTTDILFDWDKMLSLEGNSGPYLQYTYARAKSILKKSKRKKVSVTEPIKDPEDIEEKTWGLIRMFPKFSEQLMFAAEQYKPNILANYLYELAQKFNAFYNGVPVIRAASDKEKNFRLKLVEAAGQILKNGLELLGIEVVEEM